MPFTSIKHEFGTLWSNTEYPEYGQYFEVDNEAVMPTVKIIRAPIEPSEKDFHGTALALGTSLMIRSKAFINLAIELNLLQVSDDFITSSYVHKARQSYYEGLFTTKLEKSFPLKHRLTSQKSIDSNKLDVSKDLEGWHSLYPDDEMMRQYCDSLINRICHFNQAFMNTVKKTYFDRDTWIGVDNLFSPYILRAIDQEDEARKALEAARVATRKVLGESVVGFMETDNLPPVLVAEITADLAADKPFRPKFPTA